MKAGEAMEAIELIKLADKIIGEANFAVVNYKDSKGYQKTKTLKDSALSGVLTILRNISHKNELTDREKLAEAKKVIAQYPNAPFVVRGSLAEDHKHINSKIFAFQNGDIRNKEIAALDFEELFTLWGWITRLYKEQQVPFTPSQEFNRQKSSPNRGGQRGSQNYGGFRANHGSGGNKRNEPLKAEFPSGAENELSPWQKALQEKFKK